MNNSINILGIKYKLNRLDCNKDEFYYPGVSGYCDSYMKEITIYKQAYKNKPLNYLFFNEAEVLHHEIVHAYLNECGLKHESKSSECWAHNEEMVDWIAIMGERIVKSFRTANKWLWNEIVLDNT